MHLAGESLIVIIIVGLVAGWLAGLIVQGGGGGLIYDLALGIVGAFIGNWVMGQLHVSLAGGILGAIINATIGAVILLLIFRVLRGGFGRRY